MIMSICLFQLNLCAFEAAHCRPDRFLSQLAHPYGAVRASAADMQEQVSSLLGAAPRLVLLARINMPLNIARSNSCCGCFCRGWLLLSRVKGAMCTVLNAYASGKRGTVASLRHLPRFTSDVVAGIQAEGHSVRLDKMEE